MTGTGTGTWTWSGECSCWTRPIATASWATTRPSTTSHCTRSGTPWASTTATCADTLDGGAGDYVWGGAGNDALTGGAGRGVLVGGGGADRLAGGVEGDTFFGRGVAGADTSSDTFVVTGGRSRLMDFQPGTDRIELAGTTEAALRGSAVQLGDHLLLTGAGGEQIYLAWTAVAEINGVDLLL